MTINKEEQQLTVTRLNIECYLFLVKVAFTFCQLCYININIVRCKKHLAWSDGFMSLTGLIIRTTISNVCFISMYSYSVFECSGYNHFMY